MTGGSFVESLIGLFVPACGGRGVRNPPLSRVLYIFEGTTPIYVVGAKPITRAPTSFSSGDTHPHTSRVSLCQPLVIIASLPPQAPPAAPLIICPRHTTDQANRSTSTPSTRTTPKICSPSTSHPTGTTVNTIRSRSRLSSCTHDEN